MPDAYANGVTREPFLFETSLLPFLRGQQPGRLALNIYAALMAKPKLPDETKNIVHAEFVGQAVVVGVTRNHNRFTQIHTAVPACFPISIAMAATRQRKVAGVGNSIGGRALVKLQSRHRHEGLEGRTGRIHAAQASIQQRFVYRFIKRVPVNGVYAINKQIRVKSGLANKSKHSARFRVKRD